MFRRSRNWVTRSDLEAAVDTVRQHIESLERSTLNEYTGQRAHARQVSGSKAIAALLLACVLLSASALLMSAVTEQLDPPTSPGVIGIGLTDEQNAELPITVSANYNAAAPSGLDFTLAISNWSAESNAPISVILYFCGEIREGLQLANLGTGTIIEVRDFADLDDVKRVYDSALGLRTDCSYAVTEGNSLQALVAGTSDFKSSDSAGAQVSYTYPGVTTLITPEEVGDLAAWPIASNGEVEVAISNPPTDLRLSASRPLLPGSGTLSWSTPTQDLTALPDRYQVVGTRAGAEAESEWRLFSAGAFVGLGGAALLLAIDLGTDWLADRRRAVEAPR